ncbi:SUKH-4 family immunity protein [Paeniglutamicibacter antarcticus]|uniref:SUKH-4 family immunity protein n=1 Tax=Arthrobacter terrae TaxID=2935737 RepID=A0A931CLS3_9MICC|nr:SUKH-4 family immunity protein [Arthrobacter terrae]MBG0738216.1 SUKH-4 family immunity protein [Arthrobacter terrae]
MNDDQIAEGLAPLVPIGLEDIPLDGNWLEPPFNNDESGRAVIFNDGDFQFVAVNRSTGAVYCVCEDDESLMASSLAQLVDIATVWGAIDRDSVGPEDDDADFAKVAIDFEQRLKKIDPAAARPNEFWSLYAEELSNSS